MSLPFRLCVVVFASLVVVPSVVAGPVVGKLELPPPPDRAPAATKGFLDRQENPLAPARAVSVTPYMLVTLEGGEKSAAPGQVTWDLVGESFSRPVIGAPAGAEVVIKNTSKIARTLVAAEDKNLVPAGPINPTGPKSFRVTAPAIFTIGDPDAPHLKGKIVVVSSPFVSNVDESGKFEFADVPEGPYKLRIFYKDAWLETTTDVDVEKKGKTEISAKVPAFGGGKK